MKRTLPILLASVLLVGTSSYTAAAQDLPWETLASRIVSSLEVRKGERVLLRYDPQTYGALEPVVRKQLEAAGAVVESLTYAPAADLAARLARTDVYIWLPAGESANTGPAERALLAKWLDEGKGRQIHFHWNGGTRDADGLPVAHTPAYDAVYLDALNIDYAVLGRRQRAAASLLRSAEARVTTPAGTDIRFRVGDRPFNLQDGDASRERIAEAKVRVDREVELPAGVLRVAPLESTVQGTLVVPKARFGATVVTRARLEIKDGLVVKATADEGQAALDAFLASAPGAKQFREFGLGFNPKLVVPAGQTALPYYGYGDAVVRLSLGDNEEIGGAVRGGGVRWLFFPDTTVTVGSTTLVKNGKLVDLTSRR
ncbi:Thermophilic metalloprotease (M29) [Luteitalea pratensis]|uniref:Thermophilic metalloprotease (M29) n=1 Tax=Luteitalea pratensis TaxID=1855912 RepID=A0A143PKF8_LUTPR|nr:aminopeptidase [Luteitalea pratensis]AMY08254.1 Thermophilic metalloprotease (M29) [Luteitalea pratensis]